ncbi:unnamed protein product [Lota lota]
MDGSLDHCTGKNTRESFGDRLHIIPKQTQQIRLRPSRCKRPDASERTEAVGNTTREVVLVTTNSLSARPSGPQGVLE